VLEVDAAIERLQTATLAHLDAVLSGQAAPHRDEAKLQAALSTVDRWCTAYGTRVDWEDAAAQLEAQLATIAARYVAADTVTRPYRASGAR